MRTNDEGIEIHWDERRGHLSLACDREAFEKFRRFVQDELRDFPEIAMESLEAIEISDTNKTVVRRESPRNYVLSALLIAGFFIVAFPWGAGVATILRWLAR